ncbi:MAG: hypothetical protein Q4P78_05380 [Rothia sp. (in: high G+C Gram-positive bacteria)]|uniref:5-methylcytosine restriction system specificity protein McrC n=1 Tax=Rothia sp. (in: high G+C Gram-positive bacteria) TaxID=1885016 RepID=UPI0026DF9BF6|nr:hypothetical protein [Rothia sp. (in: high G+C Gram-positive bacteria)]MDO5750618.1 hypothetical protein [Rothia sp. (in: high G+C Gram-positive bacteria)]
MADIQYLRDNSAYPLGSLQKSHPQSVDYLLNQTLDSLEEKGLFLFPPTIRESENLDRDSYILRSRGGDIWTSNHVGFLGVGSENLSIRSRFSDSQDTDFFFRYMIEKVLDMPDVLNQSTTAQDSTARLNLYMLLFPEYLQSALRKGIYKEYRVFTHNDMNIRGSLDLARHIKENTPFRGKIAYSTREFSYDNPLMQLIRHTIEYMQSTYMGHLILGKHRDDIDTIISHTPSYVQRDRHAIILENQKKPLRHAYYREYRELQRLCLYILTHQNHSLGSGNRTMHGILFDCAWLWEEYIATLISEYFYHPENKNRIGEHYLFDKSRGKIYPDFISKTKEPRSVADTKYKPQGNISGRDYQQLLAYMFRFNASQGYYIYPEQDTTQKAKQLNLMQGTSYEGNLESRNDVWVKKLPFYIPQGSSKYIEFSAAMEQNAKTFLSSLGLTA